MADKIKLSPGELRTSSGKYQQGSQEIQQVLETLTREQATIRGNWEGSAFDSFDEQFQTLSPKIKQFGDLLADIHAQLQKVAEIIERTDADIAAQIRG